MFTADIYQLPNVYTTRSGKSLASELVQLRQSTNAFVTPAHICFSLLFLTVMVEQLEQRIDGLGRERPFEQVTPDTVDVRKIAASLLSNIATQLRGPSGRESDVGDEDDRSAPKRRRVEPAAAAMPVLPGLTTSELPPQEVLDAVVTRYFATIHHWMPLLHEIRFRKRLKDESHDERLTIILHAMVATTLKHIDTSSLAIESQSIDCRVQRSTMYVLMEASNSLSVEICQALAMLCFERMGSGQWLKALPLVGTLTRVVDVLQLAIEPNDSHAKPLSPPFQLLNPAVSNSETEERKRVFWVAFLLDRLASVTCGFSTAFTSDNVSRQLPCNGSQ